MPSPKIKILVSNSFKNADVLRDAVSGVEEESIPYEVIHSEINDAVTLSLMGATESNLSVGIGIDNNGIIAVHYKKLPPNMPLFTLNYNLEKDKVRHTCSNAARLVKGTPFIID